MVESVKEVDSEIICPDLMARNGVCVMPGFFGLSWRSWPTFSYGNARMDALAAGAEKMVSYYWNVSSIPCVYSQLTPQSDCKGLSGRQRCLQ